MTPVFYTGPHGQTADTLRAVILAERVRAFRVSTTPACPMVRNRGARS